MDYSAVLAVTSLNRGSVVLEFPWEFLQRSREKLIRIHTPHIISKTSAFSQQENVRELPPPHKLRPPLPNLSPMPQAPKHCALSQQGSVNTKQGVLAPSKLLHGWPDEDVSNCDGHDIIVLYITQPAPHAHPHHQDCGDRPCQSRHL